MKASALGQPKYSDWLSYLVVVAGALSILIAMWWALLSQVGYEGREVVASAVSRNEGIVIAYEEFVLRTLKGADAIIRIMEGILRNNSPEVGVRKLKESGVLDDELFQSLGLIDANGNLIANTLEHYPSKLNLRDRQYFSEAERQTRSELIVGVPIVSRITNNSVVPVAQRFSKPDGGFDGVIVVMVNASAFTNVYRNFGITGRSDYIALIGFDGIARAAQVGSHDVPGYDFSRANVMGQQRLHPNGHFEAKGLTDSITRYVSYRTLPGYPLVVSTGTEELEVLQEFNKRKDKYLIAAAIATALITLFAATLIMVLRTKDRTNAKLRSNELRLKELATHDPLTSLPNRAFLEARAAEEFAAANLNGREVACMFVDLDNFGAVNEAFGHLVGDEVLKSVAGAIRSAVGKEYAACRAGGDEFVIIVPAEHDAEMAALDAAAALRNELAKLMVVAGKRVDVRASVGISRYPQDGDNLIDLLRCADAAMLQSKGTGRARTFVFTSRMNREAEKRLKTQVELVDAIKRQELEVFYQPQLSLATGSVIGVEALVRWRHPTRGLLLPGEFVPTAEESGLIMPIGEWVLNKACVDGDTLIREGYGNLSIAVNVSALQFRQPELVELIEGVLRTSRLEPSCLELELTESMVAEDPKVIISRLIKLKSLGIRLALDDFGTGYSNLQYLRKFPIDVLKIDQSFVNDLPDNDHAASIALAVISLGRSLGLHVIAEGVETRNQQDFLLKVGCHAAQGHLFGEAMSFGDLKRWLQVMTRSANFVALKQTA